ncbi:MAG: GDP-mannose 4,6-dehydratase [Lentisphaeria bacterium]|nr:GDP-mannose 4,6-dehydratase [Lentisphaeria bacterium]MBR2633494.1 GDP-mannose 4,6-dehydratase [Lentisphaeria bacterium]
MKIFITGGAGFIGSHLTEALLNAGHEVVIADNFSTSTPANLDRVKGNPGLQVFELDIVEAPERVAELVKESDAVIHLAAAVGVEMVVKNPVHTITTNVHGTENVLAPAAKYGKRTIIASTSEVYGKSTNEKFSETDDLLIGSPFNSRWCYASSKLLDEFSLMAFHREAGLPGTVVRFFNTVGPRQTGRYGMVIPRFVAQALKNEPLTVYGDGEQSRCFCHVADVVRALMLLLDNKESIGNIYNIGSQELVSIRELAQEIIKRTGSKSEIKAIPYEVAYAKGFEDMRRRYPDTSRIKALVNWQPEHTLADIIDDVAASLK